MSKYLIIMTIQIEKNKGHLELNGKRYSEMNFDEKQFFNLFLKQQKNKIYKF